MGLTPDEYRAKWGLPVDYPMTAPSYSEMRSALAKNTGLGNLRRNAAPKAAATRRLRRCPRPLAEKRRPRLPGRQRRSPPAPASRRLQRRSESGWHSFIARVLSLCLGTPSQQPAPSWRLRVDTTTSGEKPARFAGAGFFVRASPIRQPRTIIGGAWLSHGESAPGSR